MKTDNIERYLNSFGKQVVNRSKGNLQKAKGGGTNLENSISFKVITNADGFAVQFYMSSYGTFVDKGVSGNKQKRTFKEQCQHLLYIKQSFFFLLFKASTQITYITHYSI